MAAPIRKYNPGFLTDDELVASFCVRTAEFDLLIETLRGCTEASNPHQIVIGPRGSGKTSLLLRVAAEARRDAALAACCFPVVFAEESYEVATAGEFWLECLTHLAAQAAPYQEGDPDLDRTVSELRAIRDDRVLGDRCLGALLDFADRRHKRILLLVENLNMLFRDMADEEAGWRLRKVLQTEPRIILFASATSRFDEIDRPDHALYELFRVRTLRPLDTDQCAVLWESVAGRPAARETVRSLEILTGGSPRLLAIVARFGAGRSFRELMADLLDLVDDHTEYFKSHLEALPAQERRVYLALAALWKPATAREIAEHARLEPSQCSAQLARLGDRGVVQVAGGSARRKQYYLTERLYNIYYLLRRRRGPDRLVEALVRFMASFYSLPELMDVGARMASEMGRLDAQAQSMCRTALGRLMELPALAGVGAELAATMPADRRPVEPAARAARELFETKITLLNSERPDEDTLAACEEMVLRFGEIEAPAVQAWVAKALVNKGVVLQRLNQPRAAVAAWDDLAARFGDEPVPPALVEPVAGALVMKGGLLAEGNQLQDALAVLDEVVRRFGGNPAPVLLDHVATALGNKGVVLLRLNLVKDALDVWGEVERRFSASDRLVVVEQVARALVNKGTALSQLDRRREALAVWDIFLRRFGESATPVLRGIVAVALFNKGVTLSRSGRSESALAVFDEVVRRFGESATPAFQEQVAAALVVKGDTFGDLQRPDDALAAYDDVVHRFGESATPALQELVATALVNKGGAYLGLQRPDDALAAYDDVVRRFEESAALALQELVAMALLAKGDTFGALQRPDDALAAYDEVVRRFEESATPALQKKVAMALLAKGAGFRALKRLDDALAAWDQVVRRFGTSRAPDLVEAVALALGGRAHLELKRRQFKAAIETAGRLLDRCGPESREHRLRGHLIRAKAFLAEGERSACEHDIGSILELLPKPGSLPGEVVDALIDFSVELGPERMRELIVGSRSAALLPPLLAALEQELGLKPQVPREVEEVARDIREKLARRRTLRRAAQTA